MPYILEANDNFHKWSGSRTVAIPYDIPESELLPLLRNINGVHFTGGNLELIDKDGVQHPYYVTAKRIIEFSKHVKDTENIDFPILGICQGMELISVVQNNDDIGTLDNIKYYGLRTVKWVKGTEFYSDFSNDLIIKMTKEKVAAHFHQYGISMTTYKKYAGLRDEMSIIQYDKIDG